MTGYTYQTPAMPDEVMIGNHQREAVAKFAQRVASLPPLKPGERITLRYHWASDGRWGIAGTQLSRIVYFADSEGIFDIDGSGVPSACAVGAEMVAEWCRACIPS